MLKMHEVTKQYQHHARGVTGISLEVEQGTCCLLVGENGSGKSTTIKLISRIIFHRSYQGEIINQFKQMVYMPDKRAYPMLLKIGTYLKYYFHRKYTKEEIREMLIRYHLKNQVFGSLSKGMLQKVGIIQTVYSQGDLYLLDEPQEGLDKEAVKLLNEDLKRLIQNGKSIIISTHHEQSYKELNPKIYNFKGGTCYERKKKKI